MKRKFYLWLQKHEIVPKNPFLYRKLTRLFNFHDIYKLIENVEGDIVELGVAQGVSLVILKTLIEMEGKQRTLYGFDTFKGLPELDEKDQRPGTKPMAQGVFAFSTEQVWQFLRDAILPNLDRIKLVQGDIRETLPYFSGKIALLHVDVDLYEGYKAAFQYLYDKMPSGAILLFDEYDNPTWPGATKAVDEFLEQTREKITRSPYTNLYYIVKK